MNNFNISDYIQDIVKKKTHVFFISPHLDDAALSAGGLIAYLSKKTKVTVITVFSESEHESTLSAKQFLKQAGYKNPATLYDERKKEDADAFASMNVDVIHLGFTDALWRKKYKKNRLRNLFGKLLPEMNTVYPTYRWHINKGVIAKDDLQYAKEITDSLQNSIGKTQDVAIFTCLGIGNHVDHLLTKYAVKKICDPIYWFDQPYVQRDMNKSTTIPAITYSPTYDKQKKKTLLTHYKTQIKALFNTNKIPQLDESFVYADVLQNVFPQTIQDYFFLCELTKKEKLKTYRYALYQNKDGKLAFLKLFHGNRFQKGYVFLNNEIKSYKMLQQYLSDNDLKKKFPDIVIPLYIASYSKMSEVGLLLEYTKGTTLSNYSDKKKIQVTKKILDFFVKLNQKIDSKQLDILKRPPFYFIIATPIFSLLACLLHPKQTTNILKAGAIFLANTPMLIRNPQRGFVHRDLGDGNILLQDNKIIVYDFQLASAMNTAIENVVLFYRAFKNEDFIKKVYDEIIQPSFHSKRDMKIFYLYCLYFSIFDLSQVTNTTSHITLKFLQNSLSNLKKEKFASIEKTKVLFESKTPDKSIPLLGRIFGYIGIVVLVLPVLFFVIKGEPGNPLYYQTERVTKFGGPFELSISAGRFALTESIVKYHSLFLTNDLAKFSAPDVAEYHGKFISLFTPGLSFLGVPFYLIGIPFGMPQLSAYFLNVVFALLNLLLIILLSKKFNVPFFASLMGGSIFILATNSLAYTSSFTQHHVTISLLLLLLLLTTRNITVISGLLIGILYGFGAMVDIPNIFIFLPVVIYAFAKQVHMDKTTTKLKISFGLPLISLILGMLMMFGAFAYYNYATTGSFTKVAQFIGQSGKFKPALQNIAVPSQNVNNIKVGLDLPFKTRFELHGLYVLLLSDERSWLFYSPIILLGLLGIYLAYKNADTRETTTLIIGTILMNILLYSMFGDPWGGWAFGSRYLLPSAALLCAFLPVALSRYRRNIFFIAIFVLLTAYSLRVSLLGALTTIAIPPKVEAIRLTNPVPYTYQYNQNLINSNYTSSLIYNVFLSPMMEVKRYFNIVYAYSAALLAVLLVFVITERKEK